MTTERAPRVTIHRVYDHSPVADGGYRALIDRLWPRGVRKADAPIDEWVKDAAPSAELRRWYGHEVPRFEEFTRRYLAELDSEPAAGAVGHLLEVATERPLVLVTATRDVDHSGAEVLRAYLAERMSAAHRPHR